jgi:hypothetical protein
MIRIGNVKLGDKGVYIGRACFGYPTSPLQNPFRLSNPKMRAGVIRQYRTHIMDRIAKGDQSVISEIERIANLAKAGDVTLLCWCAPMACHGDVIREIIEAKLATDTDGS